MNLTKSSGLSHDSGNRNLMMLQESAAKRELVTYPFAPARIPGMRAPSTRQELHDAEIQTVFGTVEIKNARWILCWR